MTVQSSPNSARVPAAVCPGDPRQLNRLIRDAFAGYAGSSGHPCLGARSVVHDGSFRLQVLSRLGTPAAARVLVRSLSSFAQKSAYMDAAFSSFVAVFREPTELTAADFHQLLWRQLQLLHDYDRLTYRWDPSVSSDPDDPHFSFSIAGRAFFVIGLHPARPKWARRFSWPCLVFNPHRQFADLRANGKFPRMRELIRERDRRLQGTENPGLADFGESSEARQCSGFAAPANWRCPLHVPG